MASSRDMIDLNPDRGGKKGHLYHKILSPGRLEFTGSTGIPLAFPNTEVWWPSHPVLPAPSSGAC